MATSMPPAFPQVVHTSAGEVEIERIDESHFFFRTHRSPLILTGADMLGISNALREAARHDPSVVLINGAL